MTRKSGILLHISSLPSLHGIGSFGKESYQFIDFLVNSGQTYWQILPINPTLAGNSPYKSCSSFALNPNLISIDDLLESDLLHELEVIHTLESPPSRFINFDKVIESHSLILKIAFHRFSELPKTEDYYNFLKEESYWLDKYVEYMALYKINNYALWNNWKVKLENVASSESYISEINYHRFLQYKLYAQWKKLRTYANNNGIKIIGDFPFYVSYDSADCYGNPDLFKLDDDLNPKFISGCPPDAFSSTGQLWGNPVYNFQKHKLENFKWFKERFKNSSSLYDAIRIDHFRGFEAYWEIPWDSPNACDGNWIQSPGYELFDEILKTIPKLEVIAEDLGYITEEVHNLRKKFSFPGMKILQFGFSTSWESDYIPHNIHKKCVIYTGTHDNHTVVGWIYGGGQADEVEYAKQYLQLNEYEGYNWGFIRGAWATPANLAITTYQDLLGFGSDCRMNTPSTVNDINWSFKLLPVDLSEDINKRLYDITRIYRRLR